MDIAACVWAAVRLIMSVCLCIRLHLVPGFVCLVIAPPIRRAVLARQEKKKKGLSNTPAG